MKLLLTSLLLTSCITVTPEPTVKPEKKHFPKDWVAQATETTCCKSSFDHNFNVGDCVKFNPDLVEPWQKTEGIPMLIETVGVRSYKISFQHPSFDKRTVFFSKFKIFDEDFIPSEGCK